MPQEVASFNLVVGHFWCLAIPTSTRKVSKRISFARIQCTRDKKRAPRPNGGSVTTVVLCLARLCWYIFYWSVCIFSGLDLNIVPFDTQEMTQSLVFASCTDQDKHARKNARCNHIHGVCFRSGARVSMRGKFSMLAYRGPPVTGMDKKGRVRR